MTWRIHFTSLYDMHYEKINNGWNKHINMLSWYSALHEFRVSTWNNKFYWISSPVLWQLNPMSSIKQDSSTKCPNYLWKAHKMPLDPPQGVHDSSVAVNVCHFPVQVGRVHCNDFSMVLHWVWGKCHFCNTIRLRRNGNHFADDIFKFMLLSENCDIWIEMSVKFIP